MILSFDVARVRARTAIMGDDLEAFRAAAAKGGGGRASIDLRARRPAISWAHHPPLKGGTMMYRPSGPTGEHSRLQGSWSALGISPSRRGASAARYKVRIRDYVANLFPGRKVCGPALD